MPSTVKPILNMGQVRKAARMWRHEPGRGGFRQSTRYDVDIDGKLYPPKAIASYANELAGNGVLTPKDFVGAREGKWHRELERLGFKIQPKADAFIDPEETIQRYRDDERFLRCPRAFLVTGKPDHDEQNRKLLAKNQSGYWFLKEGRIEQGDALFLLLPSARGTGGYPRELYCGVLSAPPNREFEGGKALFQVDRFHQLESIPAAVKRFLGEKLPPEGDRVMSIWDDAEERIALAAAPGMAHGDDDEDSFPEGAEKFRLHKFKERNREVVALAKLRRLKRTGKLECEACGFDFVSVYGERGHGFIEAHHRIPVSSADAPTQVRARDFELVCSNCHRMLHRLSPLMTADELKLHLAQISAEL